MARVEVQIRSCFCCGLSVATILIALYTLILYALFTGLAAWGLSDTAANGDNLHHSHYDNCYREAKGEASDAENRKWKVEAGQTTVVVEDSTSYHCSFGLYTEELKFERGLRYTVLAIDIFIYVSMIIASVILIIGLIIYNHWLLVPWMIVMAIDIIRGFISVICIFVFSHGNLARIATGIFFLGLQFFHISLLMIILAKFQRIYNRRNGIVVDGVPYDPRYPPSQYGYSPDSKRDVGYYQGPYNAAPPPPLPPQHYDPGPPYRY